MDNLERGIKKSKNRKRDEVVSELHRRNARNRRNGGDTDETERTYRQKKISHCLFNQYFNLLFLFLGEPLRYDPTFKGPLKGRSCTDIICLLLFIGFLVGWGTISWFGKLYLS